MNKLLNIFVFSIIRMTLGLKNRLADPRRWSAFTPYIDYNYLRYHGVDLAFGSVKLVGFPIIKKARHSSIIIGSDVTLISHSRGNPAGINHQVILSTLQEGAKISIGNGCGFSGSSLCAATSITIGDHTGLGVNASVYDTDFHSPLHFGTSMDGIHSAKSNPVELGKYVWVGANALILKGVHIPDYSIIPAGTVVRTNLTTGTHFQ
ncbi:MAG TPA: hypothetical protein PLG94_18365 [Smithellaceae bacterium]|nr:hypothetical protein [Smithellaceae bacterium]